MILVSVWIFVTHHIKRGYLSEATMVTYASFHYCNNGQWCNHWGSREGGRVPPLTAKKIAKNWEKEGKNQEKSGKQVEKLGRKGKNREGSFTLPLLTDKAGYATDNGQCWLLRMVIYWLFVWACFPENLVFRLLKVGISLVNNQFINKAHGLALNIIIVIQ